MKIGPNSSTRKPSTGECCAGLGREGRLMGNLPHPRGIILRPADRPHKSGEPRGQWYPAREHRQLLVVVIEQWTPAPRSKEWLRCVFRRCLSYLEGPLVTGTGTFVVVPDVAAGPSSVMFALYLACIGIIRSQGCLIARLALSGLSLFLCCWLGRGTG